MTQSEKIQTVQAFVENDPSATDAVVSVYLSLAKSKMIEKLYPFSPNRTEIPVRYDFIQCELASRLFLRRGTQGEIQNTEAGTTRRYDSVDDSDLLNQLVPFCGVR